MVVCPHAESSRHSYLRGSGPWSTADGASSSPPPTSGRYWTVWGCPCSPWIPVCRGDRGRNVKPKTGGYRAPRDAVASGSWSGSCLSMGDYVAMTPPTDEAIRLRMLMLPSLHKRLLDRRAEWRYFMVRHTTPHPLACRSPRDAKIRRNTFLQGPRLELWPHSHH